MSITSSTVACKTGKPVFYTIKLQRSTLRPDLSGALPRRRGAGSGNGGRKRRPNKNFIS